MGVDCWDIDRDARLYQGPFPVVAHPPCGAWGQLSHFARPRPGEKELALLAVDQVRKWGGVLEHPRTSKLWSVVPLPLPGNFDAYGGYTILVNQSWWGHKAVKKTFLYIVGIRQRDLPPIPIRFDAIGYTVASTKNRKTGIRVSRELSKKQRHVTPKAFAEWLIVLAESCCIKRGMPAIGL